MAQTTDYVKSHFYFVPLADLQPDPNQPRKYLDPQALEELTASVQQHGVLEPVLFRKDKSGILYVVAGERRCAAARKVGIVNIPAIYVEGKHAEIALIENLLRQDLTAIEEAEALDRVMKEYNYQQDGLARIIGKSATNILETLSLTRLPREVKDDCRNDPSVPKRILVEIAKCKQQRGMISLYKKYKAKNLSRDEVKEERTRETKSPSEIVLTAIAGLTEKIRKLDISGWADSDRQDLQTAVDDLKQKVEEKLAAPETAPKPSRNLA